MSVLARRASFAREWEGEGEGLVPELKRLGVNG
jgi:hypothetical protein